MDGTIKNNIDLYLATLICDHPIKNINRLLDEWKDKGIIEITDIKSGKILKRGSYLNYNEYKKNEPRVRFNLKNG